METEITPEITIDHINVALSNWLLYTLKEEHDSLSVPIVDVVIISDGSVDIKPCKLGLKSPAPLTNEGILKTLENSGSEPITQQQDTI